MPISREDAIELAEGFERSLGRGDLEVLATYLHPQFIWVQDHSNKVQTSAEEVLEFFRAIWSERGVSSQRTVSQREVPDLGSQS